MNKRQPITVQEQTPYLQGSLSQSRRLGGSISQLPSQPYMSFYPSPEQQQQQFETSQKSMSLILLGTMTAETRIEQERLRLSEIEDYCPEIAFLYLKHFEQQINLTSSQGAGVSPFVEFPIPRDSLEYSFNQPGFISYSQMMSFFNHFSVTSSSAILTRIVKYFDPINFVKGITYEALLKILLPQSIPAARMKVLQNQFAIQRKQQQWQQNFQMPRNVIQCIATIFDLESNLITFTDKSKLKIEGLLDSVPISDLFSAIDTTNQKFLDFNSLSRFFKNSKYQMLPNNFLGLLRRLKKPDSVQTVSLSDFHELLQQQKFTASSQIANRSAEFFNPEENNERAMDYNIQLAKSQKNKEIIQLIGQGSKISRNYLSQTSQQKRYQRQPIFTSGQNQELKQGSGQLKYRPSERRSLREGDVSEHNSLNDVHLQQEPQGQMYNSMKQNLQRSSIGNNKSQPQINQYHITDPDAQRIIQEQREVIRKQLEMLQKQQDIMSNGEYLSLPGRGSARLLQQNNLEDSQKQNKGRRSSINESKQITRDGLTASRLVAPSPQRQRIFQDSKRPL